MCVYVFKVKSALQKIQTNGVCELGAESLLYIHQRFLLRSYLLQCSYDFIYLKMIYVIYKDYFIYNICYI